MSVMINSEPITVAINSEPINVEVVSEPINVEVSGARGATGAAGNSGTFNVLGVSYTNTNPNVVYSAWDFTATNTKKYRVEISGFYITTDNSHRGRIKLTGVSIAASSHGHMRINLGGITSNATTSYSFFGQQSILDSGSGTQSVGVYIPFNAVFYIIPSGTGTMSVTLGTTLAASGPSVIWTAQTSIIIQEF